MDDRRDAEEGLFGALIGDGRSLLILSGLSLIIVGAFAVFLAATGRFLPHDTAFLGMTAEELCAVHGCRIVHFMQHDRVSFGGALIAAGTMYVWLAEFPLKQGAAWAWWLFAASGLLGFGSFLAYLGYGYLDTWHGVATLFLLPIFIGGMVLTRRLVKETRGIAALFKPSSKIDFRTRQGLGRLCLLATGGGMVAGGLTIMIVGMTSVFVPQDLSFMRVSVEEIQAINVRLMSLIAHDRAGFGGGLATCGLTVLFTVWCAQPSKSLWQALCIAGCVGFGSAIGIHPAVGYVDLSHLAPALAGAVFFVIGLTLSFGPMAGARRQSATA